MTCNFGLTQQQCSDISYLPLIFDMTMCSHSSFIISVSKKDLSNKVAYDVSKEKMKVYTKK